MADLGVQVVQRLNRAGVMLPPPSLFANMDVGERILLGEALALARGLTFLAPDQLIRLAEQAVQASVTSPGTDPFPSDRLPFGGTWEGLVGVTGGIPDRQTVFTTIQPYTGSPATINTAITNCPAGQVVLLAPGNFNIAQNGGNGTIVVAKNNVTLRGSVDADGIPTTKVIFTGTNSQIALGNFGWDTANAAIYTIRSVSAGATRGSSTVTLTAAPTGLTVGRMVFLLASASAPSVDGGGFSVFLGDPFSHGCVCTAINGTQVSFFPPLNADYLGGSTVRLVYRGAADQTELAGIENLDISCGTANNPRSVVAPTAYFRIFGTLNCWVKNCRTYWCGGGGNQHYMPYITVGLEIRHCEIDRNQNLSSNSYAIQPDHCSSMLIEDNYIHSIPNMIPIAGGGCNAVCYNYLVDEPYSSPNWLSQIIFTHTSHCHYVLFEGNKVPAYYCDATSKGQFSHSHSLTWFRDRVVGWDANPTQGVPKTSNTQCLTFEAHHDNVTIAGAVLGRPGFHTVYLSSLDPDGGGDGSVLNADPTTRGTWSRIGNYNTVNGGVPAAEAVGGGQALVDSYLHSARPSYWGSSQPWPWVTPSSFTQSDDENNFPAGYRANHSGVDPT